MSQRQKVPKPSPLHDAMRAMQSGNVARAIKQARLHLKQQPDDPVGLHMLGVILFQQGKPKEAAEQIGRAITAGSRDAAHYADWGLALKATGRLPEALSAYDQSVERDPTAASVWNDRGITLLRLGQSKSAEESFRQSLVLNARDAKTHTNLGNALLSQGRAAAAAAACRQAIALSPDLAPAHNGLGSALSRMDEVDASIAAFEHAVGLDSRYVEALGNLASLYEEISRLDDARRVAEQALLVEPLSPHATLVLAKCDRRQQDFQSGIDRLKALKLEHLPDALARDISFEQSRLYDRLGDTASAFSAMARGNLKALSGEGFDETLGDQFLSHVAALRAWVPPEIASPVFDDSHTDPVFLVGFPRSGTTLLGQILGSHSGLSLIEERPMLDLVIASIREQFGGYPTQLTPAAALDLRQLYFEHAAKEIGDNHGISGQRIVDKFPLHLINVDLIQTLFPEAQIILALRHPCDVVLSCFMQNFRPNPAMANFFSTVRGAHAYDRIMDLWTHYKATLNPRYHQVRYEDVVSDFDEQVQPLLSYLGLPWEDSVQDYAARARERGRIDTPSYHQVTEAIYTRARYRWRRYEAELQPVMTTLQPWISAFGYDDDV